MPAARAPFLRLMEGFEADEISGCWDWKKTKYKNGYGWLKVFGKVVSAHRYSYELHKGHIPDGSEILHSCDNKGCINPDHLRVGSHQENMKEAADRGRMRSGENHPMHGKKNPRPRQANKVLVLGVEYESQKSAERALGLGSGVVRYWIKNNPEKAKITKQGELNE